MKWKNSLICAEQMRNVEKRWLLVRLLALACAVKVNIVYRVLFVTSLYVPSGLQTGTKTCGKSFLACCSVYFFSATHLDVSEEHHKSAKSVDTLFSYGLQLCNQHTWKVRRRCRISQKMKNRRNMQGESSDGGGNNSRHFGSSRYLCGWE